MTMMMTMMMMKSSSESSSRPSCENIHHDVQTYTFMAMCWMRMVRGCGENNHA